MRLLRGGTRNNGKVRQFEAGGGSRYGCSLHSRVRATRRDDVDVFGTVFCIVVESRPCREGAEPEFRL
jgi:hypothetical protein